jgi:hypothetical protein
MKVLINQSILLFFILFTLINYSQEVSTVYIARNNGFAGSGAPAHVFADYEYLGKLKNKNYIIYKTNKAKLKIGLMSNFGLKRSIEVNLNPGYPTYVNVNLSKVYVLKSVNNDDKLKKKVVKRVNSEELLNVTLDEKRENLSKYRKRLSKVYEEDLSLSDDEIINQIVAHNDNVKALLNSTSENSLAENTGQKNEREKLEDAIDMAIAKEKMLQKENSTASNTIDKVEQNTIDSISVSEIYNNYLAYIDPNKQLSSLESFTKIDVAASTTQSNGMEMSNSYVNLNLTTQKGQVVGIMKMENMNSKTVFDGTSGYTKMSNGFETQFTPEQLKGFKQNSRGFVFEQNLPDNSTVSLKEFEGKQVYSVNYTLLTNGQEILQEDLYDITSFQKLATKSDMTTNGMNTFTVLVYKNYKNFNGIMQPQTILTQITSSGANLNSTISTQSQFDYKFNESFEDYANAPIESIVANLASVPSSSVSFDEASFGNIASTPSASGNRDSEAIAASLAELEDLTDSELFNTLNKREQAYQLMLKKKRDSGSEGTSGFSTNTSPTVESAGERERISKMDAAIAGKLKYRRSSLYTLMVDDNTREHYDVIKDAFGNTELSEKFNTHNIGPYLIPAHAMSGEKDQTELIENYLNSSGVARNLVAKWFNRDENGHFDMNLIAERGQYNASDLDIKIAQSSIRGKALLSDAGRELLRNTFVVVYDYKYTNKEEQANKRRGFLDAVTTVASIIPGAEDIATVSTLATAASDVVGKGYFVRTTSYLYRLVWNDEVAQDFYSNLWIDENNDDKSKKEAFENSNLFKLEYVGSEVSRNNLQSTIFSSKSNEQLIDIATTKAVDKNIGKLQRSYEQFRVKTPLLSAEPIAAKIGLKEGIEKGDKFEVLEQVLNEDGTTEYERVTTIKVDKNHIWDNTYLADETGAETSKPYTIFKGRSNKVAPGMLIRQLK